MLIGYARTSTADQEAGFEAQQRDLAAAGCEKVFAERTSAIGPRPELERALDYIRDTDTLVVTRLDRFARSTAHALELEARISAKGARLRILDISVDTATATGRLTFTLLAAVAEFERRLLFLGETRCCQQKSHEQGGTAHGPSSFIPESRPWY